MLALRTQQVLAHESGAADTADPLAGSYLVEALTAELEARARELLGRIDAMGGMLPAIESGWVQSQIHESAYRWHREVESGERVVVGVNRFAEDEAKAVPSFKPSAHIERARARALAAWRAGRRASPCRQALAALERAARGRENLMPPILGALVARATLGEVCDVMRKVFGTYTPSHTL